MYDCVITYDGAPVATVTGCPATANGSVILQQWLEWQGIAVQSREDYGYVWSGQNVDWRTLVDFFKGGFPRLVR